MGRKNITPTYGEIRNALKKTKGHITKSAQLLGVTRQTLARWAREDKKIGSLVRESRMEMFDQCLSTAQIVAMGVPIMEDGKFVGWQERPDSQLLRYFIGVLGKEEGFGESMDVTSKGEKIGGLQVEIIDSRSSVAKPEEETDESAAVLESDADDEADDDALIEVGEEEEDE